MKTYNKKLRFFILYVAILLIGIVVFFKTGCFFMGVLSVTALCVICYVFYLNHLWYKAYKNTRAKISGMSFSERYSVVKKNCAAWSAFATDEEIASLSNEFFGIKPGTYNKDELRDVFFAKFYEQSSL